MMRVEEMATKRGGRDCTLLGRALGRSCCQQLLDTLKLAQLNRLQLRHDLAQMLKDPIKLRQTGVDTAKVCHSTSSLISPLLL